MSTTNANILQDAMHRIAMCLVGIDITDLSYAENRILHHLEGVGFVRFDSDKNYFVMTEWH